MASQPRPKPWEQQGHGKSQAGVSAFDAATKSASAVHVNATAGPGPSSSSALAAPKVPERPEGLSGAVSSYAPQASRYSSVGSYGSSPYGGGYSGGMGGYSGLGMSGGMGMSSYGSYGSPYSRMGGMGAFGGGYGMGGGYGVGGMGVPGEGYPPSLTSSLQNQTAPAFAVLESLVGAFTSLAQLIESTYMATHSSFFAMVGVADQLGSLKTYLGQVLGVFSLLRLGKKIVAWLKGNKAGGREAEWAREWLTPSGSGRGSDRPGRRPSSKPLLLFLVSAVGLPYLMSRLINLLIRLNPPPGAGALDASAPIEFARARYAFEPHESHEMALRTDEIVAVMERRGEWCRGRTREGRSGWFPENYVEVIKRKEGGEGVA